jgi:transposase-like protein
MDEKKPKYRTYVEEFKLQALELLKSSGKNARQIERDLGMVQRTKPLSRPDCL